MGDIEIDVPRKQGDKTEEIVIEEDDAVPSEEFEDEKEAGKPQKGKRTTKKFFFVILTVAIVLGGAFAVIIAHQLVNPITGVQLFIEESGDPESLSVRVLVNTGMFSEYDGEATLTASSSSGSSEIPLTIRSSMVLATVKYDRFYKGNGDYVFSINVDSFTSELEKTIIKTAHAITVSQPIGRNDTSTVVTSFSLAADAYGTQIKFTDVLGNGTLYLLDNTTEQEIAHVNFGFAGSDLRKGTTNGVLDSSISGDYIITLNFSPGSYPHNVTAFVRVVFYNTLDPSMVLSGESVRNIDPLFITL